VRMEKSKKKNQFEFLYFLGKTTLIRMLAGNLEPDDGG